LHLTLAHQHVGQLTEKDPEYTTRRLRTPAPKSCSAG
jgi:hypothetical protein